MSDGVSGSIVSSDFTKSGLGRLEICGESSVAGAVRLSDGHVSIAGTLGPSGDGSRGNAMIFESGAKSLAFDAAVVKKDFYIENSQYSNLTFTGPTNVLEGFVSSSLGRNFMIDADSVLVFEGGASVGGKWNLMGGTVLFRDKPWMGAEWLCSGYDMSATRTSFEVQGSCPRMWVRIGSFIDFCVSDANTNSTAYLNLDGPSNNGGGTFSLNSTTQNVDRVYGSMGVITGNYPACIAINQSAQHTNSVSANVEGGVGFFMRGTGWFTLSGRDFTSCGDIAVDDGVFEIASDATWRNGTNVFVNGSGTLKLGGSNRFNGSFVQFHLGADEDEWMIDLPSGCAQTVDYAWDANGGRLPCGVYGATGVAGVTQTRYAAHFAENGGVIVVKRHGTVVNLR
jgi:hypothetical protein